MTDAIKDAIKKRNELSKTIRANRVEWVTSCQQVAEMIKEEKSKRWKEYVEKLDHTTSDAQVWRTIRNLDGRQPPSKNNEALVANGKAYIADKHKATQFAMMYKSFSKIPVRKDDRKIRKTVRKSLKRRKTSNDTSEQPITMQEMLNAIKNSSTNKAAGDDEIPYEMIKQLGPKALELLLHLYNCCWKGKEIPRKWRTAIIKPLLKDGKDPKFTTSYRPISLTSCLGKTLEKIIADRLLFVLESRLQLTNNQAGSGKTDPQPTTSSSWFRAPKTNSMRSKVKPSQSSPSSIMRRLLTKSGGMGSSPL